MEKIEIFIEEMMEDRAKRRERLKELDEIYNMIKENIKLATEGKGRWQQRLNSTKMIKQKERKVSLSQYDEAIKVRKHRNMRGA